MRRMALAALFLVSGCTENAILETHITLPPRMLPEQPAFAFIQFRDAAENPFNEEWAGGEDLPGFELAMTPMDVDISVVSDREALDLNVKVRFCMTQFCGELVDANAPERWYSLEHPFYLGHRTGWGVPIGAIPTAIDEAPQQFDKCDISGCVIGMITNFCTEDGRHLCE